MARPVAIITGGSSGLGAVFAERLAAQHDLVLVARRRDKLEAAAADLGRRYGTRVSVLVADLTQEGDLSAVAERIAAEQDLVLVVNNAGFGARGLFWETDVGLQEQMHRLHVIATLRLSHAALKNMVARNTGAVINVASVAGYVRRTGAVSYGASKSWTVAFTEGLYLDLLHVRSAVRVQALCPGFTYTEFHDTMGIDRAKLAGKSMWLRAEFVVDESLKGLAAGKLIVVPDWRYRAIVSLLPKLPTALRLAIGGAASGRK